MATIKSFTDLQQSRKLAEILPLESADMVYQSVEDEYGDGEWEAIPINNSLNIGYDDDILCWSLTALIEIFPKEYTNSKNQVCSLHIDIEDSETPYLIWYANPEHEGSIVEMKTKGYSNLIDACYEIVLKLNELNLL